MQKPYQSGRATISDITSNVASITYPIVTPVVDTFLKSDSIIGTKMPLIANGLVKQLKTKAAAPHPLSASDIEKLKNIDLSYLTLFRKNSKFPSQGFSHFFLSQELDCKDNNLSYDPDSDSISETRMLSPGRSEDSTATLTTDAHALYCIVFNTDGKYLAAAGVDGIIRVWEVITSESDRSANYYQNLNTGTSNIDTFSSNGLATNNTLLVPPAKLPRGSFIENSLDEAYLSSIISGKHRSDSRTRKNTINSQDSIYGGKNSKSNIYAPLFKSKPIKTFYHDKTINSLDWSKNNFLLSASEDGTVKLWNVDRADCLQTYKFESVVTCAKFHTLDDRFFLTTQWNGKLTFLSILEKEIVYEINLKKQLTCLELSPQSDLVFVGCDKGYLFSVKINKGFTIEADYQYKKYTPRITGIKILGTDVDNIEVLISATDSKIRLINYTQRFIEVKYSGHVNKSSNIMSTSNENGTHIITGSEDGWVYFWQRGPNSQNKSDKERKRRLLDKANLLKLFRDDDSSIKENKSYGSFHTNQSKCNAAIFAPRATLKLLELSNDPIFDLQHNYSLLMKKEGIKDYESNDISTAIIITADSSGKIKVFRRDSSHYIRKALISKKIARNLEPGGNSFSTESLISSINDSEPNRGRNSNMHRMTGNSAVAALNASLQSTVPTISVVDDHSTNFVRSSADTVTSAFKSENGTIKQTAFIPTNSKNSMKPLLSSTPTTENIDEEIRKLLVDSKQDCVIMQNQHSNSNSVTKLELNKENSDCSDELDHRSLRCNNCGGADFSARPMDSGDTNEIKFYCNICGQLFNGI